MFVETVAGAMLQEAIAERHNIIGFLKDLGEWMQHGKLRIIVFGAGGVGKSTFGKLISGKAALGTIGATYNLSVDAENYSILGKHFAVTSVPPGQVKYKRVWNQFFHDIKDAQRLLIVDVVCWGFHSLENIDLKFVQEFDENATHEEILQRFLLRTRNDEIETTKIWEPHISSSKVPCHMITAVTKQDLWWDEREKVRSHYSDDNSEYASIIRRIEDEKGKVNFTHNVQSVSLGTVNFKTKDGHILRKVTHGYDRDLLFANYEEFMRVVRQAAGA